MTSSGKSNKDELISLAELPLPQLQQVKTQFEEDINHLNVSYDQLKRAQNTFSDCKNNLNELNDKNKENGLLIPLTSSLYVPAQFRDISKVLVDVGTGYYVEKSVAQAKSYYEGRVKAIQQNLNSIQTNMSQKQNNLNMLVEIINYKLTQKVQNDKAGAK